MCFGTRVAARLMSCRTYAQNSRTSGMVDLTGAGPAQKTVKHHEISKKSSCCTCGFRHRSQSKAPKLKKRISFSMLC